MPVRGAEPATKPHKPLDMALKPRPHTAMRDDPLEQTRLQKPTHQLIASGNAAPRPRPRPAKLRDDPTEQTRLSEPALQSIGSGNVVKISCSRSEEARLEESVNQTMGSGNVTQQLLALTAEPCDNPTGLAQLAKHTSQPIHSSDVQSPRPRTAKLRSASTEQTRLEKPANQPIGSGNVAEKFFSRIANLPSASAEQAEPEKPSRKPFGSLDVVQKPCLDTRPHAAMRDNSTEQTRLQKPTIQPINCIGAVEEPRHRREKAQLEKPLAPTANLRHDPTEQTRLEVPATQSISPSDVTQNTCLGNTIQRNAPTEEIRLHPPTHESINSSDVAEKHHPLSRAEQAQLEERANQPIVSSNVTQKPDARDAEQRRFRTKTVCLEERSRLPFDLPERSPTPFIERILQHQGFAPTPVESDIPALLHNDLDRGMLVNLPVDLTRLGVPGPSVVLTNGKDFFRVAAVVEHLTHKDGGDKALSNVPAWEPSIGEPVNMVDLEREDDDRIMVFRNGRIQWV
jgi:hypothetical protein